LQSADLGLDLHRRIFLGELAQLHDLAFEFGDGSFEFERTASRLQEMRSADWLAEPD